jgi:hypothetical protein
MITKIRQELDESKRIENKFVISNIEPSQGSEIEIKDKDDQLVREILSVLQVNEDTTLKSFRLKSGTERKMTKMIIVELKSKELVNLALANARKLRDTEKFKDIYVNPDKTSVQRAIEKRQRERRDELNANMKHQDSMGRRCDVNNGKKSFYVARNGVLKKVTVELSEFESNYFFNQGLFNQGQVPQHNQHQNHQDNIQSC